MSLGLLQAIPLTGATPTLAAVDVQAWGDRLPLEQAKALWDPAVQGNLERLWDELKSSLPSPERSMLLAFLVGESEHIQPALAQAAPLYRISDGTKAKLALGPSRFPFPYVALAMVLGGMGFMGALDAQVELSPEHVIEASTCGVLSDPHAMFQCDDKTCTMTYENIIAVRQASRRAASFVEINHDEIEQKKARLPELGKQLATNREELDLLRGNRERLQKEMKAGTREFSADLLADENELIIRKTKQALALSNQQVDLTHQVGDYDLMEAMTDGFERLQMLRAAMLVGLGGIMLGLGLFSRKPLRNLRLFERFNMALSQRELLRVAGAVSVYREMRVQEMVLNSWLASDLYDLAEENRLENSFVRDRLDWLATERGCIPAFHYHRLLHQRDPRFGQPPTIEFSEERFAHELAGDQLAHDINLIGLMSQVPFRDKYRAALKEKQLPPTESLQVTESIFTID